MKFVVDGKYFDTYEEAEKYEKEVNEKLSRRSEEEAALAKEFDAISEEAKKLNQRYDDYEAKLAEFRKKYHVVNNTVFDKDFRRLFDMFF